MKERIVLATGAGGNDLLKSLALHGANCFNLRIFSSVDLAKYVLTKSGVTVKEGFINHTEENVYIVKALSGISYFGKVTYNDVCQIAAAIRQIRGLTEDETAIRPILEKGLFKEKNEALCEVCEKYLALIRQNNVLDDISYLRLALSNATQIDAEFITINEFPVTPLEQALLNKISGENVKNIPIQELFGVSKKDIHIEDIMKCYGAPNEVETLLTRIYSEKKLDQCTIAITDPATYSQLFFDYALLYDIPITFGCGVPIMNANPAKLLVLYYHWITGGFFGVDALNIMLNSECFDLNKLYEEFPEADESFKRSTFREVLGDICFTNDGKKNEERLENFINSLNEDKAFYGEDSKEYKKLLEKEVCIPALEVVSKEFALPVEEFITKYAYIRTFGNSNAENMLRNIDFSANDVIYNELKAIRYSGIDQSTDDIIKNVLGHNVCIQKMMEGALHVTLINKAFSSLRKNMYIAGLSALKFPGSPTENYLLLDVDLALFGECANRYSSQGRIRAKKELLSSLVNLSSSVESKISLSYAGLNVSELKRENASSVIFELFRAEHGVNATSKELEEHIKNIAYFEPQISSAREIGLAYNDGKDIIPSFVPAAPMEETVIGDLTRYYSPSALGNYFSCPRLFLLANLLGIPQPQESDPFEVIPANDIGTLAHSLMEKLANSDMSEAEFLKLAEDIFDRYLMQHPPLLNTNAMAQRAAFLDMMQNAYQTDPKREVVLAEEDIYCSHESGINIHGFPDRVEKLDDGTYLVVDYKTGGNIKHVEDDATSCMQVVLYSYLMEHRTENPIKISGAEFRYIRLGEVISCKYDDEIKAELTRKLLEFKDGMEKGFFPLADPNADDSPCKYCKYATICGLV